MAERVPARLTAAEGRKFGFTVGTAFLVLGGIVMWRGKQRTATVLLSLGGLLVLAALVAPTALGPVERGWMKLALLISKVTTPIFMGVTYFIVITPIGFIRRLAGNPLGGTSEHSESRFEPHTPAVADGARMERQF
jgi:hypothetical protein